MYELLTLYFQKKDIAFRTEENLFDIFDQELSNLENDFAKYLRAIDQNPNYQANAKLLFEKIQKAETSKRIEYVTFGTIGGHMSSMPKEPHEEFVMSFNYTRPLEGVPNYVTLHGEENQGTAMFGIADDNGYPTKTKMKITLGYRSSFFKDTRRQQKECLDKQSARTINELTSISRILLRLGILQPLDIQGCAFGNHACNVKILGAQPLGHYSADSRSPFKISVG